MDQRLLVNEEAPRFETITDDAFDSLFSSGRSSFDGKTKWALLDPFAVAVDPFFKKSTALSKDTSKYAIDLEGFEQRALKKASLASAAKNRGGALRRSSSFNNIDTLQFSTGDDPFAGFDSMPFEMPDFQRATTTDFTESNNETKPSPDAKNSADNWEDDQKSRLNGIFAQRKARGVAQVKLNHSDEDEKEKASQTNRRKTMEDAEPTTKREGSHKAHRSPMRGVVRSRTRENDVLPSSPRPTRGVVRSRTREDDVLPSSPRKTSYNSERSRPRSPKRNHTADSALLHTPSRSRDDTKHSHSKPVTIDGSSRPRTKVGSKSRSPIRTSSSRREGEKKSSKHHHHSHSARDRLNQSAGSIVSESSANSRLNKSAGSMNSKSQKNGRLSVSSSDLDYIQGNEPEKNGRMSVSSSDLDYIQENEPLGPLAKAMVNIKAKDDLDLHDTPRKHPSMISKSSSKSKHESSSSKSKHDSFSSQSKLMKDDSSGRSRDRNRRDIPNRSVSRSASRGGESDRSRSNSRSHHKKAASVSASSCLLSGSIDAINHDDHMLPAGHKVETEKDAKQKKSFPSRHRSTDGSHPISTKSSRSRGVGRSRSENKYQAREQDQTEEQVESESRSRHSRSRSEDKYDPTRHRGRTGSVEAKDRPRRRPRSTNKHSAQNRGRSGSGGPGNRSRHRRTGSVEAPRHRSGSVEASRRGRRTHSVGAKSHRRTGSVEAKSRRAEATTREGVRRTATGREPSPRSRHTRDGQSGSAFGRSNTTGSAEGESQEEEKEVFLPSISGLTGGEVPKWKVQSKAKAQPGDGDAGRKAKKEAQKARRLTQAEYGIKIGQAKKIENRTAITLAGYSR